MEKTILSGSRDTIRFYEKESLIGPKTPNRKMIATNTYKDYPESGLSDLLFIQRTKVLGFSLAEIWDMLAVGGQGRPSKKWAAEAKAKLKNIDRKIGAQGSEGAAGGRLAAVQRSVLRFRVRFVGRSLGQKK